MGLYRGILLGRHLPKSWALGIIAVHYASSCRLCPSTSALRSQPSSSESHTFRITAGLSKTRRIESFWNGLGLERLLNSGYFLGKGTLNPQTLNRAFCARSLSGLPFPLLTPGSFLYDLVVESVAALGPKPKRCFFFPRFGSPIFFPRFGSTPPLSFPCNCHHFWALRYEKCQLSQGSRGSRSPSS